MKNLAILVLLSAVVGCQHRAVAECNVDPEIFCTPFEELAAEMPGSAKEELLALPKEEYWKLHFGLGMGVRNRFGLWQDNALTRFFRDNGIDHPDSMSGPFIDGYVLYLKGEPVVMKDLLEPHVVPPPPPEPPSGEQD